MNIVVDFEKQFDVNDGYVKWIKIIVCHTDKRPDTIRIYKYENNTYDYFSDEYWLESNCDLQFTEEFTLEQLYHPDSVDAFWQHP